MLAAQQVRQAFEFVIVTADNGTPAAAVVDQVVDSLLEHALLVADDDLWRAQVEQSAQAIVPVDHPTVKIVEVARGEAAAVQLHHRAQVRRQDREHRHDHPLSTIPALAERVDDAQPLNRLLAALSGRRAHLALQIYRKLGQVDGA